MSTNVNFFFFLLPVIFLTFFRARKWPQSGREWKFQFLLKEVHRLSIFLSGPHPCVLARSHPTRRANNLLSLRSRRTQEKRVYGQTKMQMTWYGLYLPLHNYFVIHEVHLHSLPLTKSSAGEHHSQNYHMTLRSRFSQWVQLTDRPRGWPLASHSRALGKYQERKRGKKERGRNCSHGLWKRKRCDFAYTNVLTQYNQSYPWTLFFKALFSFAK